MAENVTTLNEIREKQTEASIALSDLLYLVKGTGSDRDRAQTLEELRDFLGNNSKEIKILYEDENQGNEVKIDKDGITGKLNIHGQISTFSLTSEGLILKKDNTEYKIDLKELGAVLPYITARGIKTSTISTSEINLENGNNSQKINITNDSNSIKKILKTDSSISVEALQANNYSESISVGKTGASASLGFDTNGVPEIQAVNGPENSKMTSEGITTTGYIATGHNYDTDDFNLEENSAYPGTYALYDPRNTKLKTELQNMPIGSMIFIENSSSSGSIKFHASEEGTYNYFDIPMQCIGMFVKSKSGCWRKIG